MPSLRQFLLVLCILLAASLGSSWRASRPWLRLRTSALHDAGAVDVAGDQFQQKNIVGGNLQPCSFHPKTGYFRDGFCHTCQQDTGSHTVCVRVTEEFLSYSKKIGNDLSTPYPEYGFAGLKPGDTWCLCASRWSDALRAGSAPEVVVAATHEKALGICDFTELMRNASPEPIGDDEMQ